MKPTRPLHDAAGKLIAHVPPTAIRHDGQLIVECDHHHMYIVSPAELMRRNGPECPRCHEPVDDERDEAA